MEKIIGISEQAGEYQGNKYFNYILNCQIDSTNLKGKGICVHQYKVKQANMNAICNMYKLTDVYMLMGGIINNPYEDILYDNSQRIKMINLSWDVKK